MLSSSGFFQPYFLHDLGSVTSSTIISKLEQPSISLPGPVGSPTEFVDYQCFCLPSAILAKFTTELLLLMIEQVSNAGIHASPVYVKGVITDWIGGLLLPLVAA